MINENEKKYNHRFHGGPVKGICDICGTGVNVFVHLPEVKELNGKNFKENMEIAERERIKYTVTCWKCFNKE